MLENMDDPGSRDEYVLSFGLCQPHLRRALGMSSLRARSLAIIKAQGQQLRRLLDEVVRAEMNPASRSDTARRAVAKIAGSHGRIKRDRH